MTLVINATQDSHDWHKINWRQSEKSVRKIQVRIVKAVKAGKRRLVRNLQRLLTYSSAAKRLAVKRVTENGGRKSPGVDGRLWSSPIEKIRAINALDWKGYKPQPLRRIYIPKQLGKRPLGIPTMQDRAMQMIQKFALEPVAETLGDPHSYGFRPRRSAQDAIEHCHVIFSRKFSPRWVLDADIKECFDQISHEWLLENIPMNKRILRQWLKCGYLEKNAWYQANSGTPQGGVISPILANMALDGLQERLRKQFKGSRCKGQNDKINLVRYCDDFIISGVTQEILENRVLPLVKAFLAERGLNLSEKKTRILHLSEGFNFLSFNMRKYKCGKVLTKPSLKAEKQFKNKIKETLSKLKQALQSEVIAKLHPIIKGWCNYFRHAAAKRTFSKLSHWLWQTLWRWSKRRHPNRSRRWIKSKYFPQEGRNCWLFGYWSLHKSQKKIFRTLPTMTRIPIIRHPQIKSKLNPYDPSWEMYMEKRQVKLMKFKLTDMIYRMWVLQKGKCKYCQTEITLETTWHLHHIFPKHKGGKFTLKNLLLLHPNCHRQIHSRQTAGLLIDNNFIHA